MPLSGPITASALALAVRAGGMMESVVAMLTIIDAAIGAVWTPDTPVR